MDFSSFCSQPFVQQHIDQVQKKIGYKFRRPALLVESFLHRSFIYEQKPSFANYLPSYERLEFLGDSVLNLIISSYLYKHFSQENEQKLTEYRAALVDKEACRLYLQQFSLKKPLFLGKGEEARSQSDSSLLSDFFEALLGAIYLDSDIKEATQWVEKHCAPCFERLIDSKRNWKALLQDYMQKNLGVQPNYQLIDVQDQIFTILVELQGHKKIGKGRSKKEAEQAVAREFILELEKHNLPKWKTPLKTDQKKSL